jgi:acetyl esterase/lipase
LTKKWTPIGWRNHLFRYNVLFNGAVVAEPRLNRRTSKWAGQGMLLWPSLANPIDDGSIRQSWSPDHEAPVLQTDWSRSAFGDARAAGAVFRQEVFAHVAGGGDVKTGTEPLFAWVRVSIGQAASRPDGPTKFTLLFKIHGPEIGRSMTSRDNLRYAWKPYPRCLSWESGAEGTTTAWLREPDGKIRLAVGSCKGCRVDFHPAEKEAELKVEFDVRQDASVEILLPMIPMSQEVVQQERQLGWERALAQADAYWRRKPAAAAVVEVPEEEISRAMRSHLKMAEVIAEKDPTTGEYCTLTGSWTYADVWSTPNSMLPALVLDPLGYHAEAERYLAVFRKHQGTTIPPGKAYRQHPGYLGTPRVYQAINWLSDNGALLWAFAEHALLSGDERYIQEYVPAIVKSCEWIRDARRITGHDGVNGILPGAVATDESKQVQSLWNDGWNYMGLTTAVRLLKRIKHPRAPEFEAEAQDYRQRFREAYGAAARQTPTWTGAAGKVRSRPPRNLSGDKTWGLDHAFYLDCGPLFLVFAGFLNAEEDLMDDARQWFREGPPRKTYKDDGNCWQVPSLQHEISSCEPCYSWVYFHSWQRADRPRFLEGLYSLYTGAISRQTFTVCETRGGITGVTPCLPGVWLARLAVVDDQIRENELHLLRLCPLAWLTTEKETVFERLPTEYGPVTIRARLADGGKTLRVAFLPRFRVSPQRTVLHIPPVQGLSAVVLNGKLLNWDKKATELDLSTQIGRLGHNGEKVADKGATPAQSAVTPIKVPLWPGTAPVGNGTYEQVTSELKVYLPPPARSTRAAVVICPGGGYIRHVVDREGYPIAEWLNANGIAAILLEYRLPAGRPYVPLLDAQRAIRVTRARAAEWKIDARRIGILGFSAGGHVASSAGTHFNTGKAADTDPIERLSCRPDFMLLVYPVVTMGAKTHEFSKKQLLGDKPKPELVQLFSNETQVTDETPPAFLAHAIDDTPVPPDNSRNLVAAMKARLVPVEYLELPSGGHGLNGCKGPLWEQWKAQALVWLTAQKFIPAKAP